MYKEKDILTKKNIHKVAKFLKAACETFKADSEGCCCFKLDSDLALYVGWLDGYNMADNDIIKSKKGRTKASWGTCGYAVNAGIKVRDDADGADFEFLNSPIYNDESGEVWNNDISMRSDLKTIKDYEADAKYFLKEFVSIHNAKERGEVAYV